MLLSVSLGRRLPLERDFFRIALRDGSLSCVVVGLLVHVGWQLHSLLVCRSDSTVTSHMTGATANTTDDVRCEVTLLRTVVLPVTDTTTVLADLVFVVSKSTVEGGKFTELVPFVIVLSLRGRGRLSKCSCMFN